MLTRLCIVSALLFGLMAAVHPATAAPQHHTGNTGSIAGKVTAADTGLPISGIAVTATGPNGRQSAFTGTDGLYQLNNLADGNYRIDFGDENQFPPRYQAKTYNHASIDPLSTDVVTIAGGSAIANFNAVLTPTRALVINFVTSDGGYPNIGASIKPPCLRPRSTDAFGTTQVLAGLTDGIFQLGIGSVPTYYGMSSSDYVSRFDLLANIGAPTQTMTVTLQRGGSIAGRVINHLGQPMTYPAQVTAMSDDYGDYDLTKSDGTFNVRGLKPGVYRLGVSAVSDPDGDYAATTGPTITLQATETVNAGDITLIRGSKITGKVVAEGNTPIANSRVVLSDLNGKVSAVRSTNNNGDYELVGVAPGNYRLQFNGPAPRNEVNSFFGNAYIPAFYDNQPVSSTATTINIPSTPITLTNINATLTSGGRIAGKVTDVFGIVLSGVYVSVYDSNHALVSVSRTGIDGTYITSPGLPAGQYKVRFDYTACNGRPVATAFYKTGNLTAQGVQSVNGLAASLDDATPVNVVLGQTTSGINAALVADGFSVSGRVTDKGNAVPNFKLVLNNGNEATTDAGGYYTFTAIYTGALTLAPAAGMSATTPASRNIVVGPNAVHQDFSISAVAATFSIGGRVLRNGIGVASFKLNISNGTQVTTDANGDYSVANLSAGTYTITPATGQLPVAPASRAITVPPNAGNSDFSIFQVMTPLVVR